MSVKQEAVVVPFAVFVERRDRRRRIAASWEEGAPIDPAAENPPLAPDDSQRWADDGGTDAAALPKALAIRLTDRSR